MRRRRLTCTLCGGHWPATASWCGHCGATLTASRRGPRPRSSAAARGAVALVAVVGLVTGIRAMVELAPPRPDTAADVPLPSSVPSVATGPSRDEARCDVGGASLACVAWGAPVDGGVVPVVAGDSVVTAGPDGLAARDLADGTVTWTRRVATPVIWMYSDAVDARWFLAVDESRRLTVVAAATGRGVLEVEVGNPVFPGVVDGRIAVARRTATDVHDLRDGSVVTVPHADDRIAVRLVHGAVVTWTDELLRVGSGVDEGFVLPLAGRGGVADVAGDRRLLVVTHRDGGLTAVDRATRQVRWELAPATSGPTPLVSLGEDVVAVHRSTDDVVLLVGRSDGHMVSSRDIAEVVSLHALAGQDALVVSRASASTLALQTTGGTTRTRLVVPGGDPDVVVEGDRVLVGTATGAVLLDLGTGSEVLRFGSGATTAVAADPLVVLDGDRVARLRPDVDRAAP